MNSFKVDVSMVAFDLRNKLQIDSKPKLEPPYRFVYRLIDFHHIRLNTRSNLRLNHCQDQKIRPRLIDYKVLSCA